MDGQRCWKFRRLVWANSKLDVFVARDLCLKPCAAIRSAKSKDCFKPTKLQMITETPSECGPGANPSVSSHFDILPPIATPRRRGKSLARRKYQQGYVFQKDRSKSDPWLPDVPAYVHFRTDVPGQPDRKQEKLALGVCRTRTIAIRKASEILERLGVNSAQHFVEATSSVSFREQGEHWLRSLATRKRNPLEQTTIANRRYALDKWIYPFFEGRYLADINNRAMKELVESMAPKLSASSIRDYVNVVKGVVASAIDDNGEEVFPRKWNDDFIDAPAIDAQNQPTITGESLTALLDGVGVRHRMLFALLAGCGPLRAGEALGLEIGKHISPDCHTLQVSQKAKRGHIQSYLKTRNGERKVGLCGDLAAILKEFVDTRTSGLLFQTASGRQMLQTTILRDSLHPALKRLGLAKGGFNIFRRFRITYVGKSDCPESLKNFWPGHAQKHVSERYTKLMVEDSYRLEWAERLGLGFKLPGTAASSVPPATLQVVPSAA